MVDERIITIWSDPRWRILFDVTKINRVKPWEVKLAEIVKTLLEELQAMGVIDLQSCGVAAYSAATIHRIKSERLLKADSPPTPKERPIYVVPPPVELPLPPEFMITTMGELIQALKTIFRKQHKENGGRKEELELPEVDINEFLVRLEERVEEFLEVLRELLDGREVISFREISANVDRLEAARRFILLLFAAARGVVELEEAEDGEILVRWLGGA